MLEICHSELVSESYRVQPPKRVRGDIRNYKFLDNLGAENYSDFTVIISLIVSTIVFRLLSFAR